MSPRPECPLIEERLPALLENDLPPGEALLVRAHVEGCAPCAGALRDLEALVHEIAADRPEDAEFAAARDRLTRALAAPAVRPMREAAEWRRRLLAAAAAVVFLGGASWIAFDPPGATLRELGALPLELAARLEIPAIQWTAGDLSLAGEPSGDAR